MQSGYSPRNWQLGRRVEMSGGVVAYDVFGEGLPVILVHGTPSWSFLWRNVALVLAEGFAVHVFDLLGYGDSTATGENVSIGAQSELLTELVEYWQLDAPAIVGHDIGGAVVLRSHLLDEVPFRRIALIDAVVLAPWITEPTRHMQAHIGAYRTMPSHIFDQVVETHFRTAVHGDIDDVALEAYLGRWRGEHGRAAYLQKVAQFDEVYTDEFQPLLDSIRTPVKLIWGEEDAWLDPSVASQLDENLPNSQLELISGAGHFSMEDKPDEVARILVDFLTESNGSA